MIGSLSQYGRAFKRMALVSAAMPLVACSDFSVPKLLQDPAPAFKMGSDVEETATVEAPIPRRTKIAKIEDIEQPEVFQSTDMAMWDGRPALGDIWVSVPDAIQPERVMIRNEETGLKIKGAMLVHDAKANQDAPIRLSPGAAKALGVAPMTLARVSITAIRRKPTEDASPEIIARASGGPSTQRLASERLLSHELPVPPMVSFIDAYMDPSENLDGFVEVAQAIDPDGADRVQSQLTAAEIPAEIQEDFVDGRSVYRVFANAGVDHDVLGGVLETIRFAGGPQGSDDGTLIAELPNFSGNEPIEEREPAWVAMGAFPSRNEAISVVQKLARKSIPSEICTARRGDDAIYRVFAGPANDTEDLTSELSDDQIEAAHKIENRSFCLGVAAAAASVTTPVSVRAMNDDLPAKIIPVIPDGAVRIRVGEATGGLKFNIPQPYSEPVQIPVAGIMMSMPVHTPPELVEQVRKLLLTIDGVDAQFEVGAFEYGP